MSVVNGNYLPEKVCCYWAYEHLKAAKGLCYVNVRFSSFILIYMGLFSNTCDGTRYIFMVCLTGVLLSDKLLT